MPVAAADLPTLSRLFEVLLALPASAHEAWWVALPPEQRHLEAPLRAMLARQREPSAAADEPALPKLAPTPDASSAQVGERLGPYRLIRELGQGGMGSVWLAERVDGRLARQVALKLPRLAWDARLAERMARERDIGARLEHPHIARLYDAGVDDLGRPYLALEYIDGQPIDTYCQAQGLSVEARLRLFLQVVRAVAYAHGRLVVHRDLKPSNVLVSADGQAHLLDFGIAKLVHESSPEATVTLLGRAMTPHYASPEQIAREAVTVQSDVYSLGVLLFQLLTGKLPFEAVKERPGAVEDAILTGDLPLASSLAGNKALARQLSGEVDAILTKALRRQASERYATADALAQDIERHLAGETVLARPDSVGYRLRKALRRYWLPVAATVTVLVAVFAGGAVALVQARRATQAAERERVVRVFVADLFRSGGENSLGAAGAARSSQALLDRGARLIRQRFSEQPDLQAELFGVVGQVFADMGANGLAAEYFEQRLLSLTSQGVTTADIGATWLAHAWALFRDRRFPRAGQAVQQALAQLPPGGELALDAEVLSACIQEEMALDPPTEQVSQRLRTRLDQLGGRPARIRAWLAWLDAMRLFRANRMDEAVPLWQQGIEQVVAAEGPASPTGLELRLRLVDRLSRTMRGRDAEPIYELAAAVLRQGTDAQRLREVIERANLVANLALGDSDALSQADALVRLDGIRAELDRQNTTAPAWFGAQIDFWRGSFLRGIGRVADAWPLTMGTEAILDQERPEFSARLRRTASVGLLASDAGRHELADQHFQKLLAWRIQAGMGRHPHAISDYDFIAQNYMRSGQTARALAALDAAPQVPPLRGETDSEQELFSRLVVIDRALVLWNGGDAASAVRLLEPMPMPRMSEVRATYRLTLGGALCDTGKARGGLDLLLGLQRDLLDHHDMEAQDPVSPRLAHLRALVGRCALKLGDLRVAKSMATQARAAFVAQPEVSPYFKAPLIALERELGAVRPFAAVAAGPRQ